MENYLIEAANNNIVNQQIQALVFTAFSLGLRVGLYVFFPLWGIRQLLNIIEKQAK